MYNPREDAEKHWVYTEGIVRKTIEMFSEYADDDKIEPFIAMCKYIYIEVFVHGFKHHKEEVVKQ